MSKTEEITKVIRKYGTTVQLYTSKARPGLYTIVCPGCKQEIRVPGTDLETVEYVITRGSAIVFHRACMGRIWGK